MSAGTNRVLARLAELSAIGRHPGGIDRALATPAEKAARERFASWARASGFTMTQDRVGNLFARRNGTRPDAAPMLIGSHLDTVPTGGAYDGAYGVVGALCALELLDARGIATTHPIEAVAWAGEEGSRFPLGCLGSSVFAGVRGVDDVLDIVADDGISYRAALAASDGGLLHDVPFRPDNAVRAYLELHVEQGPILEHAGVSLGIVTAIAAQRRLRAIVTGTSGHAGTVPMSMRADALCAASELVLAIERAARACGNETVATVGRMLVEPNGTNVVPGTVTFSLDLRSSLETHLDEIEAAFAGEAARVQRERNVRVELHSLEARAATPMAPDLREAIARAIASLGERSIDVPSGAGHDAMSLGTIVPAAMIFVPSIGGRSHVGEERTADRDLELGVEALAAAIVEVDRTLGVN
ncbi:MAG TPA: M20 family metallo-hydrolase [Candidatus Baltobacteraceae bacterium]|nr:M20 family metallo-hydrolase [Candidatus Baltobacteraceae bacterium]